MKKICLALFLALMLAVSPMTVLAEDAPADPAAPTETATPADPAAPTETATPADPAAPAETATPAAPAAPGAPSSWAAPEVNKAIANNLVPASLQGNYTARITRGEFAQMAVNMIARRYGKTIEDYVSTLVPADAASPFTDTDDRTIIAAYYLFIVSGRAGKDEGKFDPNGFITRQEAAKMLTMTAKAHGIETNLTGGTSFNDYYKIQEWARPYVAFVSTAWDPESKNMVMGGKPAGENAVNFDPDGSYTREQSFVTIYRLFKALGN